MNIDEAWLEAALSHLPIGVLWGPQITSVLVAAIVSWLTTLIVLAPATWRVRRYENAHWTEHSRQLWPLRCGSGTGVVIWLSASIGAINISVFSTAGVLVSAALCMLAGITGNFIARCQLTWHKHRLPSVSSSLPRRFLFFVLLLYGYYLVLVIGAVLMPGEWTIQTGAFIAVTAGAVVLLGTELHAPALTKMGLLQKPPESLERRVRQKANEFGTPLVSVWVGPLRHCNAFALPFAKSIVFTEGALECLSEDELLAITVHELGHLNEPPWAVAGRLAGVVARTPALAIVPMYAIWDFWAVIALGFWFFVIWSLEALLKAKMEDYADDFANDDPSIFPDFANALEAMYKAHLVPAVLGENEVAHSHLYDRIEASGVQPDYPRPEPPRRRFRLRSAATFGIWSILLAATFVALNFIAPRPTLEHEGSQFHDVLLGISASGVESYAHSAAERGESQAALDLARACAGLDNTNIRCAADGSARRAVSSDHQGPRNT